MKTPVTPAHPCARTSPAIRGFRPGSPPVSLLIADRIAYGCCS